MKQELLDEIYGYAQGSCKSEHEIADAFDISVDEVFKAMSTLELEWCATCGWICEFCEFSDGDTCDDCFGDKDD